MTSIRFFIAAMGASVLFGMLPSTAVAQPCCTATGSSEVSVVGRCHQAVVASQVAYERGLSSYDADGEINAREHATDDVVMTLGAGTRLLTESLQLHGSVPFRVQHRQFTGTESTSWGLGDAAAEVRWTALEDPMSGISTSWLPFFDVFAGGKFPTGRAPRDSREPTGSDITGDGAFAVTAGARLTKFLTLKDVVGVQVHGTHGFAHQVAYPGGDRAFSRGFEMGYQLSYLRLWSIFWSTGINVSYGTRSRATLDGVPVERSEFRRTRIGAHVTYNLSFPYWELTAAASTDTFLGSLGQNVPAAGPTVSLALRRTFM